MGSTDSCLVPSFTWRVRVPLWMELDFGEHMVWGACGTMVSVLEQQINAFKLVVELRIAAEVQVDYKSNIGPGGGNNEMLVKADEIEFGTRRLMNVGDMRRIVKEMKDKSRLTVAD